MTILNFDMSDASDELDDDNPLTRVEETVVAIRADIIAGDLPPDSKLAIEALRQRYSVGSSTIREALSLLQPGGLVVARGQRGFSVAPISISDLRDLSNTRTIMESHALRESIRHGDDEWEANLVAAFHRLTKAQQAVDAGEPNAADEWELRNHQFHEALTAACGSRWSLHILDLLHHHTERYRRISLADRSEPRNVHDEHKQLFDAALARDADAACEIAQLHVDRTLQILTKIYQRHQSEVG